LPAADDQWFQFRGAGRDGISAETALVASWPESGPAIVWRRPLGQGFSGISIADGVLYTLDSTGVSDDGVIDAPDGSPDEYAVALAVEDGRELWRVRVDSTFADSRGSGPRSTPTVWQGSVFLLTSNGKLVALARDDGAVLWQHDLVADFGGEIPIWGYAASVLVEDQRLYVAGGGSGNALLAFEPRTGALLWSTGSSPPSYASPIAATLAGTRQILFLQGDRLVATDLAGKELWSYPWPVINNISVATPVLAGDDSVFLSASYDRGAVLLRVERQESGLVPREVWRGTQMKNHFHMSIAWAGHLYGFDNAFLDCLVTASGEERWSARGYGKGSLLLADEKLIVLGERGQLALLAIDPDAHRQLAAHRLVQERTWTPPSLADGQLYVRTETELLRVDLRTSGGAR
jgi:outer membrane protein assembly factor BamB